MLKLKLQCFGHLMWRANSLGKKKPWCWERLKTKQEGGSRRWGGWMASPSQWTWIWAKSGRQWRTEEPDLLPSMGLQRVRHDLAPEQQQKQKQPWVVLVRAFVEWPSFWFVWCFLMTGLNLWVGGGKTSEVMYPAHWNWTKTGSVPLHAIKPI